MEQIKLSQLKSIKKFLKGLNGRSFYKINQNLKTRTMTDQQMSHGSKSRLRRNAMLLESITLKLQTVSQ